MAGATAGLSLSGSFPVIIADIRGGAFKIMYENQVIRHLTKEVGKGAKGNSFNYPYWDPNSDSAAGTATEGTDITASTAFLNASTNFVASEFYVRSFISYNVSEDSTDDITSEHKRRHGIGHGIKTETLLASKFSSFTTNTVTATSTSGASIGTVMNAKTLLDARKGLVPKPYNFVSHAYPLNLLWKSMTTNSNYGVQGDVGEGVLKNHWQGRLLGDVDVYISNQISISSSQAVCGMFAKEAIGIWVPRAFMLKADEDISRRGWELVSTQRFAAQVLHEAFGVAMTLYAGTPT